MLQRHRDRSVYTELQFSHFHFRRVLGGDKSNALISVASLDFKGVVVRTMTITT